MLADRVFKIVWVSKTQPKEIKFENADAQMIEYKGKKIEVLRK